MSCGCQRCGRRYKVDIIVSNKLWEQISPKKNGAGLLCGRCIVDELEKMGYGAYTLRKIWRS